MSRFSEAFLAIFLGARVRHQNSISLTNYQGQQQFSTEEKQAIVTELEKDGITQVKIAEYLQCNCTPF
jgi:hypothetical protein